MPSVVREVSLPPDVPRLARALAGTASAHGLAILQSSPCGALTPEDAQFSFLACDPIERSHAWVPSVAERDAHCVGWSGFPAAPRWIGVVPYEAARGLERAKWTRSIEDRPPPPIEKPTWLRYEAVARVDHVSGRVAIEADHEAAAGRLARALSSPPRPMGRASLVPLRSREPHAEHVARVGEVLRLIAQGDVYQVNLARCLEHELHGNALDAYLALFRASPAPYGFFADLGNAVVCASSPELALEARGMRLRTAPIKGTRPRGIDAVRDAALARELDADPKERAELTMAIDLHRNDLGKVAEIGSVRPLGEPRVIASHTVWSRVAPIVARRAPHAKLEDIVRALVPCGSVTGAPKIRAMEIIALLEPFRRGLYTGAFGYVGRGGDLVLAMAIRTLEVSEGAARYCVGGGIVFGSDAERELAETHWKAAQLRAMLDETT